MFSSRLRQGSARNRLSAALERRRAAGLPVFDLTLSNPTRAGFVYPDDLLQHLSSASALRYDPEPFGLRSARQAVADELGRRHVPAEADRIVLTASTSEAYSLLFKLLCDPGDRVLAPRPSYPLIEHLTDLDGVRADQYSLHFHGEWSVDFESVSRSLTQSSVPRAIITISPNNPTGSTTKPAEFAELSSIAAGHDVAVISDEVFADYSMSNAATPTVLDHREALSFSLGGLSKSIGLPQAKLAWIAVSGPPRVVESAMERLEVICDAYLSVSTPVQIAAPELLRSGAAVRRQIQDRVKSNLNLLAAAATAASGCSVLQVEGGWSAVVQVPAIRTEEQIVLDLLDHTGVLVHPGYFFDFEREAFVIVSLLPEPQKFSQAVRLLFDEIGSLR